MRSIRHTLLAWLFAGLAIGIGGAAALLYLQARAEANQIFDYQMKQLAASLPHQPFAPVPPGRFEAPGMEQDIVIQIWDEHGLRLYHSHEQPGLPQRAELGFTNLSTRNGAWRVYSVQLGDTVVQVAQPLSARREVAADMALKTVAPLFLLFPFLGALIWYTVGKGLFPVQRVAAEVQARDAGALAPITDADLPQEIRPLTHALNDLLLRLDHAIHAQRAFIADAAHELRTPLTALKLQIQLAERAQDEAARKAAFVELRQGFDRTTHLVQQLLTLARQEPGASPPDRQAVDLAALAQQAVAGMALAAQARQIRLSLDAAAPALITGDPEALRILLNNLIDNAIRYTPDGGRVDVSVVEDDAAFSVQVQDTGPGIPKEDRSRVFDRFYRVPGTQAEGSGLGLSIVKQIADAHQATVALDNTGHGLHVSVVFPRSSPA